MAEYHRELNERLTAIEILLTEAADKAAELRVWIDETVDASLYTARLPWLDAMRVRQDLSNSLRDIAYIREDFCDDQGRSNPS